NRPIRWWKRGARLFVAEGGGAISFDGNSDKAAFESARLLVEVTADWKYLPMFPDCVAFLLASGQKFRANLSMADLSGANLSMADLESAKVCLCNSEACTNLRDLLVSLGWNVGADGLLAKVEVVKPVAEAS